MLLFKFNNLSCVFCLIHDVIQCVVCLGYCVCFGLLRFLHLVSFVVVVVGCHLFQAFRCHADLIFSFHCNECDVDGDVDDAYDAGDVRAAFVTVADDTVVDGGDNNVHDDDDDYDHEDGDNDCDGDGDDGDDGDENDDDDAFLFVV